VRVPSTESTIEDQVVPGRSQESFFAVFDGHNGSYVSEFLERNLHSIYQRCALRSRNQHCITSPPGRRSLMASHVGHPGVHRRCRVAKQGEEVGSSLQEVLRQTYKEADDRWREVAAPRFAKGEVDVGMAGSCSLTVLLKGRSLYVANAGDSSAMLVRVNTTTAGARCEYKKRATRTEVHRLCP